MKINNMKAYSSNVNFKNSSTVISALERGANKTALKISEQTGALEQTMIGAATTISELKNKLISSEVREQENGKVMNIISALLKKIGNSKRFEKLVNAKEGSILDTIIAYGNAAKEAVGTAIYTVQALTNEDLAPDKRKFVGMYDLAVGVVSTSLCLGFGILAVKYKNPLAERMIGKKFADKPGFKIARDGIAFLIPSVLQQIIIKRIISPAVATPAAGKLKKKLENKEAGKKGETPAEMSPLNNPIILGQNGQDTNTIKSPLAQFNQNA